ncbi:MAG: helix-turn-helix domain-containing protein [Thermincola sp.]|jgi:sugar diacid utilization regulator/putative methionine-R-sulfoxide reductase with GAF domain|nr:helix-turn-helix domain-containing protein [Thermincola sp.]MDT3704607.1 helix-turn-helix domain-containing protein [Thermincola sp.]
MPPGLSELVSNSDRLHEVIEEVINLVTRLLDSEMAGVMLYNEETDELVLQKPAFRLTDEGVNLYRVPLKGGGNAVQVYTTGQPYITSDSRNDSRFLQRFVMLVGAKAAITVPLKVKNRRIGVLHVNNKRNGEYNQQDLKILTFLASHLALSIENTILYEKKRKQAEELAELNKKLRNHQLELEKLIRNHNLLLRRVLNEEGIAALVKTLANTVKLPVIVEDRYFNLITSSCPGEKQISSGELLKQQGKLSLIKPNKVIKSGIYVKNGREKYRVVSPIGDTHMILGYMSLEIDSKDNIDNSKIVAFEQGVVAIALEMMKGQIKNEVVAQFREEFLKDLFSGDTGKIQHILHRADLLRYDLSKKSRVAVICLKNFTGWDETPKPDLRPLILAVQNSFPGCFLVGHGDRLEALLPVAPSMSRDILTQKLNEICRLEQQFYPKINISVGVGCECKVLQDYPKSYQQSKKALEIGEALENSGGVIYYDHLGVYSLLFEINDSALLKEFVEARIGPLLDYDHKKDSSLVITLEKYLKCRGSIKETASLLYVHVGTVKYRLTRIKELLTFDLDRDENHFDLQLALYALRILEKGSQGLSPAKTNNMLVSGQ